MIEFYFIYIDLLLPSGKFYQCTLYSQLIMTIIFTYRYDGKALKLSLLQGGELCGALTGLQSSDIVYIQQAATNVEIKVGQITVSAQIIHCGIRDKGLDVLNIEFVNEEVFQHLHREEDVCNFSVQFILKLSYFQNLHESLDRITVGVIKCLIPEAFNLDDEDTDQEELQKIPMPLPDCLSLDKEYQLPALKKMMACDSSVPFLVTGPFGTGKTRLMIAAAIKFLERPDSRIVLCASHLKLADAYIDNYFGPMFADQSIPFNVKPIRLVGDRHFYRGKYDHLLANSCDDSNSCQIRRSRLIITTFLTAPKLIRLKVKPFTHILIDEGAQLREPEAIAPLGLADDNTKIVIAGDHLEVLYQY